MRVRKKKNLAKRLDACEAYMIYPEQMAIEPWKPEGFDHIEMEIGCGKGRFITQLAQTRPDTLFIAVEREKDVIVMAAEKALALGLSNIRFLACDADELGGLFGKGEISVLYINFCDPWPGTRQAKRRLTYRTRLMLYRQILPPAGIIRFKTDGRPLYEFSLEEFAYCGFDILFASDDLHRDRPGGIMTEYEEKFVSQGVPICAVDAAVGFLPENFVIEKKRKNAPAVLEGENAGDGTPA